MNKEISAYKFFLSGAILCSFISPLAASAEFHATAAKAITGRAPGLSFDNGVTISQELSSLLSFTLPDGTEITPTSYPKDTKIRIQSANTLAEIKTKIMADNVEKDLSTLPDSLVMYKDEDGDRANPVTQGKKGKMKATWQVKTAAGTKTLTAADLNNPLVACDTTYMLTISATNVVADSQYGLPKENNMGSGSHTYTLVKDSSTPTVCFAEPESLRAPNQMVYDPKVWSPNNGFFKQSSSDPSKNFPTTGFKNALFYLVVSGIDAKEIKAENISYPDGGNVRVSISVDRFHPDRLVLKLDGPDYANPAKFEPTTVKITVDNSELYSFRIQRWFITQRTENISYNDARKFCSDLSGGDLSVNDGVSTGNYRLVKRGDISNATSADARLYPPYIDKLQPGNKPPDEMKEKLYSRAIGPDIYSGGSLTAEWGNLVEGAYYESQWKNFWYWTSENATADEHYVFYPYNGKINWISRLFTRYLAVCRAY